MTFSFFIIAALRWAWHLDPADKEISAQYIINRQGVADNRDAEPKAELTRRLEEYGSYGLTTEEVELLYEGGVKPWDVGIFASLYAQNAATVTNAIARFLGLRPRRKRPASRRRCHRVGSCNESGCTRFIRLFDAEHDLMIRAPFPSDSESARRRSGARRVEGQRVLSEM